MSRVHCQPHRIKWSDTSSDFFFLLFHDLKRLQSHPASDSYDLLGNCKFTCFSLLSEWYKVNAILPQFYANFKDPRSPKWIERNCSPCAHTIPWSHSDTAGNLTGSDCVGKQVHYPLCYLKPLIIFILRTPFFLLCKNANSHHPEMN